MCQDKLANKSNPQGLEIMSDAARCFTCHSVHLLHGHFKTAEKHCVCFTAYACLHTLSCCDEPDAPVMQNNKCKLIFINLVFRGLYRQIHLMVEMM